MKKLICALLVLLMLAALAGCGDNEAAKQENNDGKQNTAASSDVDVDLTKLSGTMAYSEVYNMMTVPENYIGKTVRMSGQFTTFTDDTGASIYYACVIADATACCQQGLEFILEGDAKYPDDYPKLGTEITVIGEFRTYMEGQHRYCHLVDAVLTDK